MKALCNYGIANPNRALCFSRNHMYDVIGKYIECISENDISISSILDDTEVTHFLILDVDYGALQYKIEDFKRLKSQGIKFILLTFDPANFWFVDTLINENILDKVIIFDKQYVEYFKNHGNIEVYVSDYFFNEDLFNIKPLPKSPSVCVFGHLIHGREVLPTYNSVKVDININSYQDLYSRVQLFNGAIIHDTGTYNHRIIHHNKAKAVEVLMCGVNAYCYPGINTKRYNQFLKEIKEDHSGDLILSPVEFDRNVITELNKLTVKELIDEINNT
jgi:hypothetical protein